MHRRANGNENKITGKAKEKKDRQKVCPPAAPPKQKIENQNISACPYGQTKQECGLKNIQPGELTEKRA